MSDREVFNTLERAISGDINDLQALATRQMADQLQFLLATRFLSQTGGSDDTTPKSATGGLSIRSVGGGTQIELQIGFLAQFSTTWPAVAGALESNMRLGYNRSALTLTLPGTPSQAVLLEARVVDVVTLNTFRDVFDVPTQTFISAAIDKRIERQIQTQFVEAASPLLPGFSGDPWVPLYAFLTDGSGETDLVTAALLHDFRPDMQDILQGGDQLRGTYSTTSPEGVVEQGALQTGRPGVTGDVPFVFLGGDFAGRIGDRSYRFRSASGNILPSSAVGFSLANDTIAHVYLLPLINGSIELAPWNGTDAVIKGTLHLSGVQPANGGRVNSAPITPNATLYGNFDAVPAGRAMYVGSIYGGTAAGIRYMTQSGGGRAVLAVANPGNPLFEVGSLIFALTAGETLVDVDLRGLIPDAARLAILEVNATWGSVIGDTLEVSVQPSTITVGNAAVSSTMRVLCDAGGSARNTMVVDAPVFFQGNVDNGDKRLSIRLIVPSSGNAIITVSCIGWEF